MSHSSAYWRRANKDHKTYKKQYSPGTVKCLKCDVTFKSWDTKLNRICPVCAGKADDIRNGVSAYFLETATHFA